MLTIWYLWESIVFLSLLFCWEVPHVGDGFIYLFGPFTYLFKLLGWYMVLERVPIPSFLCSPHGSYRSCIAHVAGLSMKSVGLARKGECWEIPDVGHGFIYLFGPSTYQPKLLGWYMVSYMFYMPICQSILST